MLDTGSDVHVTPTTDLGHEVGWHQPEKKGLGGINGKEPARVCGVSGAVALAFRNDVLGDYSTVVSKVLHVPVAPHIILSHTLLEDSLGWEILYRRGEVRVPGGGILKIHHASGG